MNMQHGKSFTRDLEKWPLKELVSLEHNVKQAIEKARESARGELKQKMQTLAESHGFSVHELFQGQKTGKGRYKPSGIVKYRNPENPELVWSGRGRIPFWLSDLMREGHDKEDFLAKEWRDSNRT